MRHHGSELSLSHRLLDVAIVLSVLWVSAGLYGVELGLEYGLAGMVAVACFLSFAEWHALYGSWRSESIRQEIWVIASIWMLTCAVLLALAFFSKSSIHFSRVTMLAWMMATPVLLVAERAMLRHVLRHFRSIGFNSRSVAIVGGGKSAAQLIRVISDSPWMGLIVKGVYDDEAVTGTDLPAGDIEALMREVQENRVDCVYITYPMREETKISRLVTRLADTTASVHIVPDIFVSDLLHARWTNLGGVPLVSIFESPFWGVSLILKRIEDLILGSLILLLISPVMLWVAIAVKQSSPGPVIFKQRRYGLNGQVIEVWKFRSMTVQEDGADVPQAKRNDPRITPLGAFLRKTSLDELPQFINVLQGQMSIVGPRPHAVTHNEQYRKLIHGYMLRHKVKPGITGWAQVHGWRGETDTTEKMEMRVKYDLEYINNWSLWLDLKIIWMTLFGGMKGNNAY